MSKVHVPIAASMFILMVVTASPMHAADDGSKQQSGLNFKGKVVMLIIDRSSALEKKSDMEYIADAVVQKLGDRYFITGDAYSWKDDSAKERRDWRKGSQVGIAWDKVQQYYVFSPERMDEIMKKRQEEEK